MVRKIIRHKAIVAVSFVSIAFAVGGFLWAGVAINGSGGGPFILHFNDMVGITSVGGLGVIIFMGILGIVVTVMNFFIALSLGERDAFLGKMLVGGTLIFAILLFIAFASILNVN